MSNFINKIKASGGTLVDIVALSASTAGIAVSANTAALADYATEAERAASVEGLWHNESGNLELIADGENLKDSPKKLNLVAAGAIQVKVGDGEPLQFDAEQQTQEADKLEYGFKICNGAFDDKNMRVIATKLNTAELVIDTQKSNSAFTKDEFNIKVRTDKWNDGVFDDSGSSPVGPIYLKTKARAFDFRCYDHGGIALQIAGKDGHGNENKIKFESDRISLDNKEYCGEGGKGIEFGTFNTEHTSLYTGDYRFKGEATVYGVSREFLGTSGETGKIDFTTQSDDFKDKIDMTTPYATWNEILNVARDYADGTLVGGGSSSSASGETSGGTTSVDLSAYAKTAQLQAVSDTANQALTKASEGLGLANSISAATKAAATHIYRKEKDGETTNLEIDVTGVLANANAMAVYNSALTQYQAYCEEASAYTQYLADVEAYNANLVLYSAYCVSLAEYNTANEAWVAYDEAVAEYEAYVALTEAWDAYNAYMALEDKEGVEEVAMPETELPAEAVIEPTAPEGERPVEPEVVAEPVAPEVVSDPVSGVTEPTEVLPDYASIDLMSSDKISLKANITSVETANINFPFEISKKGKFTMCGKEIDGAITKDSTNDDLIALIKNNAFIAIHSDKNNASGVKNTVLSTAYPEGSDLIKVSVYDLLACVQKIADLEARVQALENPTPEAGV